jgi:hypothetical protein
MGTYRNIGDRIEGEKIVMEAGFIKHHPNSIKIAGHTSDRAEGKLNASAWIDKPFRIPNPTPIK